MTNRVALLAEFIQQNGWQNAVRTPLAADASTRSYDRLIDVQKGRNAVLMNAPVDIESNITVFVHLSEILKKFGLSAPEVYAIDTENGFLLIEDLGDDLFARVCQRNAMQEAQLYQGAIDVLLALHQKGCPENIPVYNAKTYLREAQLLTDWYLPMAINGSVTPNMLDEYNGLVNSICAPLSTQKQVLVLRDYHAENLLWLPKRTDERRVGLLDYQDALIGHPAYDLVSLLEDARRDTSAELRKSMKDRYISKSGVNTEEFELAYSTLGAQRNLKIIGIFSRLYLRDGKVTYLDMIPRVWHHLMRDISHPALADLQDWIIRYVPEPDQEVLARIRGAANDA